MEPRKSLALACGYFDAGLCRSCTLLDVAYDEQLRRKQQRVRELIDAAGQVDWLSAVASETGGFRTKAKLVVGGTTDAPTLGILDHEQHGIDLEGCPIVAPPIRAVLPDVAAFITRARLVPYDIPARRGELKNVIVVASARGELMVRFVLRSTESIPRIRKHLPALREALPQLRVVTANLLPEHKAIVEGDEELVLTEEAALPLPTGDVTLELLPRSFVQTNEGIAARLYRQGAAWVDELAPSSVWDLYCGVGGFALHAARSLRSSRSEPARSLRSSRSEPARSLRSSRSERLETIATRHVTGVELSPDAVESARRAASAAALDADFVAADATRWAGDQASAPELVIVNPPRRGLGPELSGWLERSDVAHVLYSSCNADTLATDLAAMPSLRPVRAQLFDMFPHTGHFETLVLLERR